MPIAMNWLNPEKTIYFIRFIGNWTVYEMSNAVGSATTTIGKVNHNVVLLLDFTDSKSVPDNFLSKQRSINQLIPENLIYGILFGGSTFIQMLYQTIKKIYARDDSVTYVESYELALQIARKKLEEADNSSVQSDRSD